MRSQEAVSSSLKEKKSKDVLRSHSRSAEPEMVLHSFQEGQGDGEAHSLKQIAFTVMK